MDAGGPIRASDAQGRAALDVARAHSALVGARSVPAKTKSSVRRQGARPFRFRQETFRQEKSSQISRGLASHRGEIVLAEKLS